MIEQLRRPDPPASNLHSVTMKKYGIIGDVHSQLKPLEKAANYCLEKGLTPILLGDLFDSRIASSDSAGVYNLARKMQAEMDATVLQSNHHAKLQNYARGKEVFISEGFQATLNDFEQANIHIQDVAEWLESLPFGIVFKDSKGIEYRCAHAMFPRWIRVPSYEDCYKVDKVTSKSRGAMLYGPKIKGATWPEQEDRIFWWQRETDREWVRVAGHYHVVHTSEKNLVLDGGMGGSCREEDVLDPPGGSLCLWDVEDRRLVQFPLD